MQQNLDLVRVPDGVLPWIKHFWVNPRIEDGEKLLAQLARSGFDVAVALWVLASEDSSWRFYIASNAEVPVNYGNKYGMLYVALAKVPDAAVALSEVKLVHPSEPIALAALALRDRSPARLPVRYRGKSLADLAIEEAYIYPKIGPMTRDEVLQTIVTVLNRNGRAQPLAVTFANGKTQLAIPTGIHLQLQGSGSGLQIVLLDPATGQSLTVAADEVIAVE